MKMAYDSCFRRLAVEIGGPKRLYSIILFFSAIVLTPLAVLAITNGVCFFFKYSDSFANLLFFHHIIF